MEFESKKMTEKSKESYNLDENAQNAASPSFEEEQEENTAAGDDWAQNEDAALHLTEAADEELDELSLLQKENAQLKDAMLRALAEAENTRKRAEKQIVDGRNFAITSFARELLSVVDNLRRALEAASKEEFDEKTQNILTGVDMTEKELVKILDKNNVKELKVEGMLFDPNLHEALFEIPNSDADAGTVLAVVDSGWTIGERLLRPAKVGVAAKKP